MLRSNHPVLSVEISLHSFFMVIYIIFYEITFIRFIYRFEPLLTTSGPRDTFSRLSTTRGCMSIIKLLQFTIVRSFWASLGKALF